MATFTLKRDKYTNDTTLGKLYGPDDKRICYTLEDTVRPPCIKVYEHTAILGGSPEYPMRYKCSLRYSPSFKRQLVVLSNTGDPNVIINDNVKFEYVMLHGLNKHEQSKGCPGVAYNRDDESEKIWGNADKEVTELVKSYIDKGEEVYLDVINLPQDA